MIIECKYCHEWFIVDSQRCKIFRHGVYKKTGKQVHPHASDEYVATLVKNNKIFGCGHVINLN